MGRGSGFFASGYVRVGSRERGVGQEGEMGLQGTEIIAAQKSGKGTHQAPPALLICREQYVEGQPSSAHPRKSAHRLPFELTKETLSETGLLFHCLSLGHLGSSHKCPGLMLKETATEPDLHLLAWERTFGGEITWYPQVPEWYTEWPWSSWHTAGISIWIPGW